MSKYAWEMTTPKVITQTHWKIANIEVETARTYGVEDKDGWIKIWLAPTYKAEDGTITELDIVTQRIEIIGAEYEQLISTEFPEGIEMESIQDLETFFYSYLVQAGHIPDAGQLVDMTAE